MQPTELIAPQDDNVMPISMSFTCPTWDHSWPGLPSRWRSEPTCSGEVGPDCPSNA